MNAEAGNAAPDLSDDVAALTQGHGVVEVPGAAIRLAGADAAEYLHGQLSQDVKGLAIGQGALSFLLEPQGRLVALGRLTRTGEDAFLFDVDPAALDATVARLQRFRLRAKVEIEAVPGRFVAVLGAQRGTRPDHLDDVTVLDSPWPGLPGWDLFIATDTRTDDAVHSAPGIDGARWCAPEAYEAVRIAAGVPAARDLDERVIPAETGVLDLAVSFTKGCYTGQELVGRMDARGNNAPRRLLVVRGDGDRPEVGAEVQTADGKRVGTLTSVAPGPDGGWVGLGLLGRAALTADGLHVDGRGVRLSDAAQG